MPATPDHDTPVDVGDARPKDENVPPGVGGQDGILLRIIKDRRTAFLFVGGVNTAIGAMWFLLFDWWLGPKWNGYGHYPALVITYVAAILCAFVLYRKIVFRVHGHVWRDLGRFSTVYISAFAVNLVLLWVMIHVFHWHPFLSQCLITFVTTVFSWVGHNRYSFRRPSPNTTPSASNPPAAAPTETGASAAETVRSGDASKATRAGAGTHAPDGGEPRTSPAPATAPPKEP